MGRSHEYAIGASSARNGNGPLKSAILNCFGDVTRSHIGFAGKVRNRARNFENAVITPRGQAKPANCMAQQIGTGAIGDAVPLDFARRKARIRFSLTGELPCSRVRNATLNR